MSTVQEQARALGDPTRYEIFRFVADTDRALDLAELVEHFGLGRTSMRQHLHALARADLITQSTADPAGRGRPRLRFAVHPNADGRWGVQGPYERLSLLLAEIVRTGLTPIEVGRRAGRRLRLGRGPSADPVADFVGAMATQGFDPSARRDGDRVDVVLRTCPFVGTALADPETVCTLHLGLAQGVAEAAGGVAVEELVPHDPRRAHCRLGLRVGGLDNGS